MKWSQTHSTPALEGCPVSNKNIALSRERLLQLVWGYDYFGETRTYIAEKGKELGSFGDWSLEDKHEYSLWVAAQGIPQDQTVHGLPGEDNMSRDEAVQLAKETIMKTYRLKKTALARFNVQVEFNVIDAGNPVWQIYFDVKNTDDFAALGLYHVSINDATREIVKLEDASSYAILVSELTTLPGAAG